MSDSAASSVPVKKVKFPIGVKLALILGVIILVSLGSVTALSSILMGEDVRRTAEQSNFDINQRAADTIQDKLSGIRAGVFQLLDLMNVVEGGRRSGSAREALSLFFERNADIAGIFVLSERGSGIQNGLSSRSSSSLSPSRSSSLIGNADERIINAQFFTSNEIEVSSADDFVNGNPALINRSCRGETVAANTSVFLGLPSMALLFPWKENGRDQCCLIIFSVESISDILGTGSGNTTFMINDSDELLLHPETERILPGESFADYPLVSLIRQNGEDSRQIPFSSRNADGKISRYFGAYEKIQTADIIVITEVSLETVLSGVYSTMTNNIFITGIVFFLSVMFILFFSRFAISNHLRKLSDAANEIQNGNFETKIIDTLNTRRKDEIGVLNEATQNEREFLNTFAKFTNKNVAKAIARKEIDFEPHLKDLTIFFSDIRGFTAISDGFREKFGDNSPREIIAFLNDYMERMVECVSLSGGTIDKFEGDAIMAVWGILRDDNLRSKEHILHVKEDAVNAIRGTCAMRYSLMKYNKEAADFTEKHKNDADAKYKPQIKIGCGLNTGRATAGIMGGKDKLEYTAIGDAVNFASRTESSNKACGTDILISADTYNLLKKDFIRCKENSFTILPENLESEIIVEQIPVEFEVKGKGSQHFYGVVNMPNFDIEKFFRFGGNKDFVLDSDCAKAIGKNGPKTLNEVRNLLGIPVPDFEKVNLNAEENKVQVKQ